MIYSEEAQKRVRFTNWPGMYWLTRQLIFASQLVVHVCVMLHCVTQSIGQSEFACAAERDEMVSWLHVLTHELDYCHEVFFRAVVLLDSFLSSVKVPLVYTH